MISKLLFFFITICITLSVVLLLDQIWFEFVSRKIFWKLIITIAVLLVAVGFMFVFSNSLSEENKLVKRRFYDK
jgi:hypothetical protein